MNAQTNAAAVLPSPHNLPLAVATWSFGRIAVEKCSLLLEAGANALDAVEGGVTAVELDTRDQYFVGLGGLPNGAGDVELDAAVMDGSTRSYGAVMALRGVLPAIRAARLIMERSPHNVLAGDGAAAFALAQGMNSAETLTEAARDEYEWWRREASSKADAEAIAADATTLAATSGPRDDATMTKPNLAATAVAEVAGKAPTVTDAAESHDTIGLICMDVRGNLAAGTSTSGWKFKHPGRVGDSPMVGSGLYCDGAAGAAVATGDGEEIMRCCLSFLAVEFMRSGDEPNVACRKAIARLREAVGDRSSNGRPLQHDQLTAAVLAVDCRGRVGAASTLGPDNRHRGRPAFPYAVWRAGEPVRLVEEGEDDPLCLSRGGGA